jgi:hypothetical protein
MNFKGKKYTCVRSQSQLVWNKGVDLEPKRQASSNPSPGLSIFQRWEKTESQATKQFKLWS